MTASTLPLTGIDTEALLEFWRWLLPATHKPLFATALGDLFLADPDGQIVWLDLGSGQVETVAPSEADFAQAAVDPENATLWFGANLVDALHAEGKVLGPGECYSYLQLPLLGGEYEPANFKVSDLVTHFRVWGPIHEQLHDLPDGATVEINVTE